MRFEPRSRRGLYLDASQEADDRSPLSDDQLARFESFDLIYRSLCALLFNYVPTSGHPGGSVSSGRIVASLLFGAMRYDTRNPLREDADLLCYAAGHKALGLYALWALRDEVLRVGAPDRLPAKPAARLRLEDLLGFRRNPVTRTPLFVALGTKALDGHPTPATPFVRVATGASGVGVAAGIGLALGARDAYGSNAPRIHILEGEGGLTPGRVSEALAAAATSRLDNVVLHIDWNQASIDSERVCRDGSEPGDYVQWDPVELAHFHDWNVIEVADGFDFRQVARAQRRAAALESAQPTAIVYRTVKGWRYGVTGRASHGAGHGLCSDGFYEALGPLLEQHEESLLTCCDDGPQRCKATGGESVMEECFWDALQVVRRAVEHEPEMVALLAGRLREAHDRLEQRALDKRPDGPNVEAIYRLVERHREEPPAELAVAPGSKTTLRGELGRALGHLNQTGSGALLAAAADLLGSTSVNAVGDGFPAGYFNTVDNPNSRLLSLGGICEDAMTGILCGASDFGQHIGVASSYAAFIAALGHVPLRLHCIGNQAAREAHGTAYRPMILVCAHAGLKTGEDGPTHADPQPLQLLQENFPLGTSITLTPWEPAEVWPLLATALARRPAVIVPFVTRPPETVPDRERLGLAPATRATQGLYKLRAASGRRDGTVVLQGSGVALAFVNDVLPQLEARGVDLDVYHVSSAELFDALPPEEQARIFPEEQALEAMGLTGFTLPTMYRWIRSERGRAMTLHPFRNGHFLGSGAAASVLEEAGLDGTSQFRAILRYLEQSVATR